MSNFFINPSWFGGGGGLPYTPPLDAQNAAVAYSIRKLRTDYLGSCLRVQRSSDNTSIDIGFDSNGYLDITSITSFVGAGDGYITDWYDQTGNGVTVQSSGTNRPVIVSSGVLTTEGSLVALSFNNNSMTTPANLSFLHNGTSCSLYVVTRIENSSNPQTLNGVILTGATTATTTGYALRYRDTSGGYNNSLEQFIAGTSSPYVCVTTDQNIFTPNLHSLVFCNIDADNPTLSNRAKASQNNGTPFGNNILNGVVSPNPNANAFYIGSIGTSQKMQNSTIQEVVIFDTDQSLNESTLQTNINDYFSIY